MVVSLRIGLIGAGQVNFGGGEGAWDHATRLEKLSEEISLVIVSIADPDVKRAEMVLSKRRSKSPIWQATEIYSNYIEMLEKCVLSAVFIGIPPYFHGSMEENRDVELQCLKRGVHMFIEKPISCAPIADVERLARKFEEVSRRDVIVSVGYMFRYSKGMEKVKRVIEQFGPPKAFNARYACAYSTLSKPMWWDVAQCGGPIVEQATHFCDLARFLVGEVDLGTLMAVSVKHEDLAGKLEAIPANINEDDIPKERRIPRVTSAFWKFKNGAIGTLMHGVLLHESKYECEFEIWGDGYRILVLDPYHSCKVSVRFPRTEETIVYEFDDDYYLTEDKVFLEAVRTGNSQAIKSSFSDAFQSYKFTWEIKTAAEKEI